MDSTFESVATSTGSLDNAIFENLRDRWSTGKLRSEPRSDLRYATQTDVQTLYNDAQTKLQGDEILIRRGLGAVILAGGLATRFGGTPKAGVEIVPDWSLLRVKLNMLEASLPVAAEKMPVLVVVSEATKPAVHKLISRLSFPRLEIELTEQGSLPQLLPSGEVARDRHGNVLTSPAGHGSVLEAIAKSRLGGSGIRYWQISNIDNVVTSIDPSIVALHHVSGVDVTVEVVGGTAADVGGYLIKTGRGMEIAEGFQVPAHLRPQSDFFFSTNTMILGGNAIDAGVKLPFYAVEKRLPSGQQVVQFEQLLGDLGHLVTVGAVEVPREGTGSRFIPLKRVEDLESSRQRIIAVLRARGLQI